MQLQSAFMHIGVRDRRGGGGGGKKIFGKPWKFGQMLGKIKKIRSDLSENRLNSGNFITILQQNSGKLSTAPLESINLVPRLFPLVEEPRTPMFMHCPHCGYCLNLPSLIFHALLLSTCLTLKLASGGISNIR
jgi:hypothetical protein